MLISVFGTPSPLTHWTVHAVRNIMQCVHPNHTFIGAVRMEEFRAQWDSIPPEQRKEVVFFSDCPEPAILELFQSARSPIMLIIEEPRDIVPYAMTSRALPIEIALRFMTQSFAAFSLFTPSPTIWNIRNSQYQSNAQDYVRQIIEFFGINASPEDFARITSILMNDTAQSADPRVGDVIMKHFPEARWPGTYSFSDPREKDLFLRFGDAYSHIAQDQPFNRVILPREIFYDGDRPNQFVQGPQPLLGRGRTLVYGPYIHLPIGQWFARVELEVLDNLSGNKLYSDVAASGKILAGITAPLPKMGVFGFEMAFEVTDPSLPLEIRFQILFGAIEGVVLLRRVEIVRQPPGEQAGHAVDNRDLGLSKSRKPDQLAKGA